MWVFAVRNRPLEQTNASIVKNDVRMVWEVDAISAKTNSTKGCEQSRSEMERWTGTPEGTWNVPRMFRETHAISAIASSTKNRMWARVQLQGCEAERQKLRIFSQCENILLRSLSFAQFIRLSWITSDEKKVNKPLRLSHVTPHWMH